MCYTQKYSSCYAKKLFTSTSDCGNYHANDVFAKNARKRCCKKVVRKSCGKVYS